MLKIRIKHYLKLKEYTVRKVDYSVAVLSPFSLQRELAPSFSFGVTFFILVVILRNISVGALFLSVLKYLHQREM